MNITRRIVRVGNSAGVILPREWLNGMARVELIEKPSDLKKDIMEILDSHLEDIIGIYLVGSYARNEQDAGSDIDVLVITNKTNEKISRGKYNIILISKENLEDSLRKNALPVLPMLKEAKVILNSRLIEEYKKTSLTKRNIRGIIGITKSSLNVTREFIKLAKETKENLGDGIAYSLVLCMRTLYILDCLRKEKKYSSKGLTNLVLEISGDLEAYGGYIRSKNNKKVEENLTPEEAQSLHEYATKKLEWWEKWLKERRN